MDKTLQTTAWNCLPREFREEVKKEWSCIDDVDRLPHDAFLRGKYQQMRDLFGIHNLTSDAEGEDDEVLTVSRKDMQFYYQYYKVKSKAEPSAEQKAYYKGRTKVLLDLFGSKCLPDEKVHAAKFCQMEDTMAESEGVHTSASTEPKFKVGDKVRLKDVYEIEEIDKERAMVALKGCAYMEDIDNLEPYAEPLSKNPPENCDKGNHVSNSRNLSQNCDKCPKPVQKTRPDFGHSRLNIAAMAMQGILANPNTDTEFVRATGWNHIKCGKEEYIASKALRYADALINEAEKGGNQ